LFRANLSNDSQTLTLHDALTRAGGLYARLARLPFEALAA
jgi:hypothetical protein